jgi:hypothetical protein
MQTETRRDVSVGVGLLRDWATILPKSATIFGGWVRKKIMIKNGLYTLTATALDGVDGEVGGVLILHDGKWYGGDSYVFYTGTYDCSHGKWKGEMTSQEHTPTKRPMAERHQHIGFSGTYNDTGAKADATALVGEKSIRYDATLRLLVAV